MRRLVLMPDYEADPLWDDTSGGMVALSSLPISISLQERLLGWRDRWDALAEADWYGEEDVPDGPAWADHAREERDLWMALREELGAAFAVGVAVPSPRGPDTRVHVLWEPDGEPELAGWFRGKPYTPESDDHR